MDECSVVGAQVADEMLEFWCNLVGALSASSIKEVEDRFRPYIDRLVICLCHLCKFDASEVRSPVMKLYFMCLICIMMIIISVSSLPVIHSTLAWTCLLLPSFLLTISVCFSSTNNKNEEEIYLV